MTNSGCSVFIKASISAASSRSVSTRTSSEDALRLPPYVVAAQTTDGIRLLTRNSESSLPSVVPPNKRILHIFIASWCDHFAVYDFGLGVADKYGGKHINLRISQL